MESVELQLRCETLIFIEVIRLQATVNYFNACYSQHL